MDAQALNPATIRHIVLDFGGVLYDIDYGAPARAFEKLGWTDFAQAYGQGAQNELFDGLELGTISEGEFLKSLETKCWTVSQHLAFWAITLRVCPMRSSWLVCSSESSSSMGSMAILPI